MPRSNGKPSGYLPLGSNDNGSAYEPRWGSIVAKFWTISLILGGVLILCDYFEVSSISKKTVALLYDLGSVPEVPHSLNGYLIKTPGCRIPDMDPFDSSVKAFIFKPQSIQCNGDIPPLFESNLTSIYLVPNSLPSYNLTRSSDCSCCYEAFSRKEPADDEGDKQVVYSGNCIAFSDDVVEIKEEFVKVVCKGNLTNVIYEDYFAFVPSRDNTSRVTSDRSSPSVMIIGLDAVSRVNLHRQLRNTTDYLKQLGAIELLGYNKVADNTFPNLIPVFTGMFQDEMERACNPDSKKHFDNCPFVWKTGNDYTTAIGEDCAWIGLFNYLKIGFKKQPADYYFTAFNRESETRIGNNKMGNCIQCMGGRESYKVTLDYVKKFALRMEMERRRYFGFFWGNSLSHDYLNWPALGDETYLQLFKELKNIGTLENTVVIFMSDHGIRWGDIRQTYQGQMEERLPFVVVILPKRFKDAHPEAVMNLNKNVRRLTTPFDLHETLKDLLDVDHLTYATQIINGTRGYSLFKEIPKNRTCEDAAIVSHWCTCQQSVAVATNDTKVMSAARFAVDNMNEQLIGYAECANLKLDDVLTARVLSHDSEHITDKKSIKDYTITLKTVPGEAIFEVTVRSKEATTERLADEWQHFSITGTVSRLNLYGKQSYCITDFHLKLYCYCESLLKS